MLGTLRLFLASSGQQNEPADTCLHRLRTEGLNGFGCSWHGEIRIIGDVDRADAIENRRPAARRLPVEGRGAASRTDPDRQTAFLEPADHPAARLSCSAEHKRQLCAFTLGRHIHLILQCEQRSQWHRDILFDRLATEAHGLIRYRSNLERRLVRSEPTRGSPPMTSHQPHDPKAG